jgi:hypothetical protein
MTSKKCVGPASGSSTPKKSDKSNGKSGTLSKSIKPLDLDSASEASDRFMVDTKHSMSAEDNLDDKMDKSNQDSSCASEETVGDLSDVTENEENEITSNELAIKAKSGAVKSKSSSEKRSADVESEVESVPNPPKKARLESTKKVKDTSDSVLSQAQTKRTSTPNLPTLSIEESNEKPTLPLENGSFDANILSAMRHFYSSKLQPNPNALDQLRSLQNGASPAVSGHSMIATDGDQHALSSFVGVGAASAHHPLHNPLGALSPSIDATLLPHLIGSPLLGNCMSSVDSAERSTLAYLQQANMSSTSLDSLFNFQRSIPSFAAAAAAAAQSAGLALPYSATSCLPNAALVAPLATDMLSVGGPLDVSAHANKTARTCGMSNRAIPSPSKATSNEMPSVSALQSSTSVSSASVGGTRTTISPKSLSTACDEQPLDLSCKSRDTTASPITAASPTSGSISPAIGAQSQIAQHQLIRSLQQIMAAAAIPNDSSAMLNNDLLRFAAQSMNKKQSMSKYGKPDRCDNKQKSSIMDKQTAKSMLTGSAD